MDFSFFTHRFFGKNVWKFLSNMGNPLGVYKTSYKVRQIKNLLFGKIWPPSDLLFLEWSYCTLIGLAKGAVAWVDVHFTWKTVENWSYLWGWFEQPFVVAQEIRKLVCLLPYVDKMLGMPNPYGYPGRGQVIWCLTEHGRTNYYYVIYTHDLW